MLTPITQTSLPRFSGKTQVSSDFAKQFKPGEDVYFLKSDLKTNQLELEKKTIKAIIPHGGQPDSQGNQVLESDLETDLCDRVTFTNGKARIIGSATYNQNGSQRRLSSNHFVSHEGTQISQLHPKVSKTLINSNLDNSNYPEKQWVIHLKPKEIIDFFLGHSNNLAKIIGEQQNKIDAFKAEKDQAQKDALLRDRLTRLAETLKS